MSTAVASDRLSWAVDTMSVRPSDRLVEVGCGRGVAVSLICRRLIDGTIVGIDRSEKAIEAAAVRNAADVASGKATFHLAALEDWDVPAEPFDKIFAVNVNLFWVRPVTEELALIRRLLAPGGAVYLCYEPPSAARLDELATKVREALSESGFLVTELRAESPDSSLVCLVGRTA